MENIHLSEGVSIEELDVKALKIFEENQTAFENGFVKFQPSGQVINLSALFLSHLSLL